MVEMDRVNDFQNADGLSIRFHSNLALLPTAVQCIFCQKSRKSRTTMAQSICTHYFCFKNIGRFVTLKKIRSKIWTCKKQGAKKRVIVVQ